jgi:hypothetical protein
VSRLGAVGDEDIELMLTRVTTAGTVAGPMLSAVRRHLPVIVLVATVLTSVAVAGALHAWDDAAMMNSGADLAPLLDGATSRDPPGVTRQFRERPVPAAAAEPPAVDRTAESVSSSADERDTETNDSND